MHGAPGTVAGLVLRPLGAVWGTMAAARGALFRTGWRQARELPRPVISVGALSVGGVGKTPAVAALAGLLRDAGLRPAILSRGYGRRTASPLLVSDGAGGSPPIDAARSGDEPALLARTLPSVPVAVAARREEAAAEVLAAAEVDLFLLDDGFQHLRVARDVDLLVVDSSAPFWRDRPLPAGRLREWPGAAGRADAFLLVEGIPADPAGGAVSAAAELARRFPDRPVFELTAATPRPRRLESADPTDATPAPGPLYAFAGIARPERFRRSLEVAGHEIVGARWFADHHRFTRRDLAAVVDAARAAGAATLATTEKDAVRIPSVDLDLPCTVWSHRLVPVDPASLSRWTLDAAGLPGGGAPDDAGDAAADVPRAQAGR